MRITRRERVELNFNTFCDCSFYELFLEPENWDVGGGKMTIEEIDIIKEYPDVKHIAISGLYQDIFEYFIKTYGKQFEAICFWKNKLVSDWSLLGELENVECICYFFNQRLEHLWDMSKNKKLKYLSVDDFSRLKDYSGVEKAPALEGLNFGNKVWARTELSHFPDMTYSTLKKVVHNAQMSMEDAYNILKAPFLEQFDFGSGTYPTEFIAWICANYPHIKGFSLKPYIDHGDGYISVTGKRKKTFDATTEKGMRMKINAVDKFEKMLSKYKGMTFDEIVSVLNKSKEVRTTETMTEKEMRNLQVYIGKRSQGQTDEQVIEHIEKINGKTPLTQEDWHKLIVPCCNNGDSYVLKYVLQKIDTLNNLLQYMQHTVYGRNEYLNEKRIDVLRMFMEYLGDNRTEYLNETMISAAWFGETAIVKFLIENGADRMYQNAQGLNLEKCAERAEKQFKDSSLKEFLAEEKKGKGSIWSRIKVFTKIN